MSAYGSPATPRRGRLATWCLGQYVSFLYWCVFRSKSERLVLWALRRIRS